MTANKARGWGLMAAGVAAGAGALVAGVGLMGTSAWLIGRAAQRPPVLYLMVAIVAVRFFGLARGVLRYTERLAVHDAALRVLEGSRAAVFRRLVRLAPAGLRDGTGARLELVVSAVDAVADRWSRGLLPMVAAGAAALAAVVLAGAICPAAGAVLLATLLVGGVLAPLLAARTAAAALRREAADRAALAALTTHTLQGLPELTAHGAVPARLDRLAALDTALSTAATRSAWTAGLGSALTTLSCGVAVVGALAAARAQHLGEVLTGVVALVPLAAFEPVAALSVAAQEVLRTRAGRARLAAVLDAPDPVREAAPGRVPADHVLRVRAARTRWPAGPEVELPDLELRPGRRIALLGPSGVGKSTLVAVLQRFLEYDGSVTLGGVELRDLPGETVREIVGVCSQDAHLFDTTVAENLRLARPDATDAELTAALRAAGLADWQAAREGGLDSRVGEHGTAVSGGEHRRLALARALLADFPILLLDEPDAHLDEPTADALLGDLLRAAGPHRGVLLITHRAAFPGDHPILRHVDEVIALGVGKDGGHVRTLRDGTQPPGPAGRVPRRGRRAGGAAGARLQRRAHQAGPGRAGTP